jgi:hypothetical protein
MSMALAVLFLAGAAEPAGRPDACSKAFQQVRRVEAEWLETYKTRDSARMAKILAPEFLITHPNGRMQSREEVLGGLASADGRPGPSFATRDTTVRCRRGVVVLTGWVFNQRNPEESAARYTDTYVRAGKGWQVLASHLSRRPPAK